MRKDRSKREGWQSIIDGWVTSGQSQKAYCASRGIVYSTFCYWNRRLQLNLQGKDGDQPLRAIEVRRLPHLGTPTGRSPAPRLDLETQGIVIRLACCDANVTIAGRLSIDLVGRIMAACEGIIEHARA